MAQGNDERLTFSEYSWRWPDLPGHARAIAFDTLSCRQQAECWSELAERCRTRIDDEHAYEREALGYEPPPAKRHQPTRRQTAATSTRPGTVEFSATDDPLKAVPAAVYFEVVAGIEVPSNGRVSCPAPGHEDRNPACRVYETDWHCFACGAGGSIIDLGAAVYGLEPRGADFHEIRRRLLADLGLRRPV